jgi:hypothetical protein
MKILFVVLLAAICGGSEWHLTHRSTNPRVSLRGDLMFFARACEGLR